MIRSCPVVAGPHTFALSSAVRQPVRGIFSRMVRLRALFAALLLAIGVSTPLPAGAAGDRTVLWNIVTNCLDASGADYCTVCRWPRVDSACSHRSASNGATEVWAESADFVVLRDSKMCGCPEGFVHGLAIPRARVTGVEDPRRPDGIWAFAWAAARKRMGDDPAIALAVNPLAQRGQDQLHVHLLRLHGDAGRLIAQRAKDRVQSLDHVWKVAARRAAAEGLTDYGVLVVAHREGGFMVLVAQDSPEKLYTDWRCR
ncbi:CDP-diacylglycerol diphosphatase [Oryzomonas japonica]|uniref:CDP-diacylglycerol diphosphatase n=1 Tax=Oryzomonas japonica TaxID=2603858 RepID=UPI00177AFF51|nr:CDP-diacylglycerol diphosphatase [Oryzomonas japonica]